MHLRRAVGIVTPVERRGPGLHDHKAGAGMAVPTESPAGRDLVLADGERRRSLRIEKELPVTGLDLDVDVVGVPLRDRRAVTPMLDVASAVAAIAKRANPAK